MRLSIISILIIEFLLWITVEGESESWIESIISSFTSSSNTPLRRSKRSLADFENVIQCFQPWINVLAVYADYGCFCGAGGHGRPLDDTDKCCFYHDKCYEVALIKTKGYLEYGLGSYFTSYNYECVNQTVTCKKSKNSAYQQALCECDRKAGECFLFNRRSYSRILYDVNTDKYCSENADYHDLKLERHTLNKLYTCELEADQDRCCVGRGYNSVFYKCCDGTLRELPKDEKHKTFKCCSNHLYDDETHICCYGTLHPSLEHSECCGTEGGKVDLSTSKCVDGKVVPLNQTLSSLDETTLT